MSSSSSALKTANTKKTDTTTTKFSYEFGGPIGTFVTIVALPIVVVLLSIWTDYGKLILDLDQLHIEWNNILLLSEKEDNNSYTTTTYFHSLVGLIGWFGLLTFLWWILPGTIVQGVPINTSTTSGNNNNNNDKDKPPLRLDYKLNGHLSFWVVVMGVVVLKVPLNEYLYDNYTQLAIVDIILCSIASFILYVSSYRNSHVICAKGGNSGNPIYDFFMGRELNPRTYSFDWKVFCELRPGLIGWMLLNYACLQQQYVTTGQISGSMILVNVFQAIYVWDALYQERAILTTMDVTTDGFGYMLVFGDLVWVPFTYSVPARYLVKHDPNLSSINLIAIIVLHIVGYAIFRLANGQKDQFRRNPNDPSVVHLQYLQTKRGTRLLTSGWWGMARKINYTGDYIMGCTWCMVCGTNSIVPYYYAIYFAILLIHRSIRDDELCHTKYGDDWLEYKRLVPYKFIPGIV